MFGKAKTIKDLGISIALELDWSDDKKVESIRKVFKHVMMGANETVDWYLQAKNTKKFWALFLRVVTIILGSFAAILPILGEILGTNGTPAIKAGWSAISLGIAGALLLLDRFYGFSTGWMRYIVTELQLRQVVQEFQLSFEAELALINDKIPTSEQIQQLMARCKTFTIQINSIIREETSLWVQEFRTTISYLDEAATVKAKSASAEPGAFNLTITNGDKLVDGWDLSIDDSTPERYKGRTVGKRNIIPGKHEVKIRGEMDGKAVQVEKVITVLSGQTCDESMTLS